MNTNNCPVMPGQQSYVRLVRLPEVLRLTALSRSEWYRRVANKSAPSSIRLGERCTAWVEAEICEWVQAKIDEQRGAA